MAHFSRVNALLFSFLCLGSITPALASGTTGPSTSYQAARAKVMSENPQLRASIMRGGSFSGPDFSAAIANRMYSRKDASAIEDARKKLRIESQGRGVWLLRLPFVNIAVIETDEGLVLIDSGYAPAGPALKDALSKLSSKPVHTIIFTHYHADHAFGAWPLMESERRPRVIAQDRFIEQLEYDMKTYGLIARNNNQFLEDVPRHWGDAIRPTQTFDKQLTLSIGGITFNLHHAKGETEDHLWVHIPSLNLVISGDLFQDFLPNAGNGRRRVRFAADWAQALRAIVASRPDLLLPMHGPPVKGGQEISHRLTRQAEMLESIVEQVLNGLNAGQRQDLVVDAVQLPERFIHDHDARELYVTAKDIARMVIKEHSGWWDDIPSNWNPPPLKRQAEEIIRLAGGIDAAIIHAQKLAEQDTSLAIRFADWIWLAHPENKEVIRASLTLYGRHVSTPRPTQEALVCAEHMIRLQEKLSSLTPP
ncbi:MAG: hypothetical protein RLY30_282 [Pseudomonadota bacterium]